MKITRRGALGAIGTAVVLGPFTSTAQASTQALNMYMHTHDDCSGNDKSTGLDGAYNFRDQFNSRISGYEISVHDQGYWSGDASRDKLESDWELVPNVIDPSEGDGIHHFIVSEIFEGIGASDHGYGHRIDYLTPSHNGACVTNVGALRTFDGDTAAENLVIHETLHCFDVGHEHGDTRATSTRYTDVSPMSTAYVRSSIIPGTSDITFQGTGAVPDEFCDGTENNKARTFAGSHTTDVSSCSVLRASIYLSSQYDDGGDPPCLPGEPCPVDEEYLELHKQNMTNETIFAPLGEVHHCY